MTLTNPRGMAALVRTHGHVVVDTRGGLEDQDLIELYDGSDRVVIPTVVDSMSLQAMVATVQTLKRQHRGTDKLRVLFTRASTHTCEDITEARDLVESLDVKALTSAAPVQSLPSSVST